MHLEQNKNQSSGLTQYDSTVNRISNINVLEAYSTKNDIYFNETYLVIGENFQASKIHASYNLTIIGNIEADELVVNGELIVNGKISVNKLHCLKRIICSGTIKATELICDNNAIAEAIICDKIQVSGNVMVNSAIDINERCDINNNALVCEGINGSGIYNVPNTIVGDYFEFDGQKIGNIFEISTMFQVLNKEKLANEKNYQQKIEEYKELFADIICEICDKEEEEMLKEIHKCSEFQKLSFDEMEYLLNQIIRISYLDKIDNYRDYLFSIYAYHYFPNSLKEYETIEHVFNIFITDANKHLEHLNYIADNLMEFIISLKAIIYCTNNGIESVDFSADKVFSAIGIRYSTVKRQLKGEK